MHKYYFYFFLCFCTLGQAQNISIDSLSFQYVFMEFRDNFDNLEYRRLQFEHELENQNINESISGELISIYLNDQPPVWQLAYPVESVLTINPPLHYGKIAINAAKKIFTGRQFYYPVKEFILQLRENEFYQNDPTMIRWLNRLPDFEHKAEIIIPVNSSATPNNIFYKISRLIISVSVILCLLLGIMLLLYKKGPRTSNIIFSLFLISYAITSIDWIFGYFRFGLYLYFPHLFYIGDSFQYLIVPLLFLYILSMLPKKYKFKKWYFLHFMPFITVFVLWIERFYRFPADIKRNLYLSGGEFFSQAEQIFGFIVQNVQLIGYTIAALIILSFYKRKINNKQSLANLNQINWLYFVVFGFFILNVIGSSKHIIYLSFGIKSDILFTLRYMGFLIFVLVVLYYNFNHPYLFSKAEIKLRNRQKSSLSDPVFQKYKSQLVEYMDMYKPYLNPDISLNFLSDQIAIPPRSLSEVINRGFNMNFFEFINSYRIKEAKYLIKQSTHNKKTILEVLYEVGYNNKSVFNMIFKKYTGKTPTQYRTETAN